MHFAEHVRGHRCTDTYVRNKPKTVRSGKLIQQAKCVALLVGIGSATREKARCMRALILSLAFAFVFL